MLQAGQIRVVGMWSRPTEFQPQAPPPANKVIQKILCHDDKVLSCPTEWCLACGRVGEASQMLRLSMHAQESMAKVPDFWQPHLGSFSG